MANEVLLGLKIGGVVSGSFNAAFGTAKSTVQQLGRATDGLAVKQQAVGNALSASLARGGTGLVQLRRQYDALGNTIDQLKAKQDRLTASIERGAALKNQRRELRGQAMEVIGTGVALGAPVLRSFNTAVDFQDQTRDIAITGGFNPAQEQRLSLAMRGAALRWNQTQTEVANGTAILIAGGIDSLKELTAYAPVMAKTATATRASMKDLGSVTIALNDNLGIGAAGFERSMNMLAFAGKSGQFELADMAKWLPQLTPQFAALGITGERAVAEIGAALQIARRGAGSNDEAANNYKNFLSKITAPETLKAFEKAGIDLKGSMKNLVSEGLSPAQAMLNILTAHLGKKAPTAAAEYGKALDIKDEQERAMALARLDEAYKLGALFADQQVLSFVRPALANQKDLASIEQGSESAADQGVLDQDWAKRMGSSKEQLKELRNNLTDVGLSVGSALLPAIVEVSRAVVPLMRSFSAWAEQHPDLIRGVVGLVGGLLLGKLAFIGVAYGAHLVMAPFVALTTTVTTLSAKWAMLRTMWQMGKFTPLITGLSRSGAGLLKLARGALHLGKMLGGTLWVGLKLVGQAVLWLGRALMLNPIGLAITGIALAAYLIYRYWAPIKTFFTGLWNEVRAGFDGGLSGILAVLLNFSPLGLFYRAFAGVMNYFGIELPGTFTEFGSLLVTGLVNGIGNMAGALKDSVVGIGASVKDWFTETLGIESPSRVFIGYGANISEGAALGIKAQSGLVRQAALSMAAQSAVDMAPPNPAQVTRASMLGATGARSAASESTGSMTFHFSPQINVPSGAGMEQISQGLHATYAEWVRLMERYLHDKRRHSYGPANEVTA
ncbi:Phage-related minor tail protein [Pseudomonas fluorescens]|nr:Phage-related minor tail protein [Pseudomonas fluorescens]